ncbi:hypothetical protein CPC08DRAFT_649965 [Agrocybe pediades]|nr:hypothetical protein CPC08DRAFT_649965 [Agrocybe pediades]
MSNTKPKATRRAKQLKRKFIPLEDPDDANSVAIQQESSHTSVISTQYSRSSQGKVTTRSTVLTVEDVHSVNVDEDYYDHALYDTSTPDYYIQDTNNIQQIEEEIQRKKRRSDEPLKDWVEEREVFLSEFLRLEGDGPSDSGCANCVDHVPAFRCLDCDTLDLLCRECILRLHCRNGLHRIEEWDVKNRFFKSSNLCFLGHTFQLGHRVGDPCPCPSDPYGSTFTVLDLNGVHEVSLKFCNCEKAQLLFIQLLRYGWFPATVKQPRTAVTFRLLKFFQLLSFESKTTVYELHSTLARLTDNIGVRPIPDRYSTLLRVVREYRHLKMLKRAGRGHNREGAAGTKAGECAVLCPACPQKATLPDGWRDVPEALRFLYCLFLGLDANFRLKRRMISSNAKDPSLSHGWSYFVEEKQFKNFLHEFGTLIVQEPSTCSNHDAVNRERATEGYAATGVGTCDCIRHDMKRPTSVGDLQKGERYVNMDYIFFSSLQDTDLIETVVSYDIACQWSLKLWERMKIYPNWMHIDHENKTTFRFLVPKFHLPAHIKPCHTKYSFNFNKDVGRTDGEGVERGWSFINPIATSTREMGPGSRRDTIDDHFGDWNWKKTTRFAVIMLKRFEHAVPTAFEHSLNHDDFTQGLRSPDLISEWSAQLAAWEKDHSQFNPLETQFKGITLNSVQLALAEKEREDGLRQGLVLHESTSASQLISLGMDLEIQQRKLALDLKELPKTDHAKARWTLRANALTRKIANWIDVQHLYAPGLQIHRQSLAANAPEREEEIPAYEIELFLPSRIPRHISYSTTLADIEFQLRYAQCSDALDDLRSALCLRAYVILDKARFQVQRGRRANTRSQGIVDRVQERVAAAAERYRKGREALVSLSGFLGKVGWERDMLELKPEDVRPDLVSEGHRSVSWIWRQMGGDLDMDTEFRLHESMRIEWCKSKARVDRWKEEVLLLQEEKRRILAFFEHRARQWEDLGSDSSVWMLPGVSYDPVAISGRHAYARQQAHQFRTMRDHFVSVWKNVDGYVEGNGEGIDLIPEGVVLHEVEDDENVPIPSTE